MDEVRDEHLAFSAFLFSPPISTPGTIQVNGCRSTKGEVYFYFMQPFHTRRGGVSNVRYLQKLLEYLERLLGELKERE